MPKLDHHISGELHYRHKKGLLLLSQLGGFGWRDIGETLALYFGGVHYQHKKGLLLLSQQSGFGWRDIGDTLAPYFGEVHYWHKKGLLLSGQLGGFGWPDIGDTLALYFSIFSRLMHEADSFSIVGHLSLTCHTLLETVFVIGRFFFFFFFFGRDGYSLYKCNDSNLKSMRSPPQAKKAKANNAF